MRKKRGSLVMRSPPGRVSQAGRNQPFCLGLGRPAAGCDPNIQPSLNETVCLCSSALQHLRLE